MTSLIRRFKFEKSDVEPQSLGEALEQTDRSVHPSKLGLRVVNPSQGDVVVE